MTNMIYRLLAVTVLAILVSILLSGCANPTKLVRVNEYGAGGGLIRDATVGGCVVYTSDNVVSGDLTLEYEGTHCKAVYRSEN